MRVAAWFTPNAGVCAAHPVLSAPGPAAGETRCKRETDRGTLERTVEAELDSEILLPFKI